MVVAAVVHRPAGAIQQVELVDALAPQRLGIVVEEGDEFFLVCRFQARLHNQLHIVAHENTLKQSAVTVAFIAQQVVSSIYHVTVTDSEISGLAGIFQVRDLLGNLIQLVGGTQECSLIVREREGADLTTLTVDVVVDGTGGRVEQVLTLPIINLKGPLQVFLVLVDIVEPCGNQAGRTVGAGILAPRLVVSPGDATPA